MRDMETPRAKLVDAGLMGPGCGESTCPCEINPWRQACLLWEGGPPWDSLPYCPRCGWVREEHALDPVQCEALHEASVRGEAA